MNSDLMRHSFDECLHKEACLTFDECAESESESKSESPGVVATSLESELELESIKLPRLQLWVVDCDLTRFGLGKNIFGDFFFGIIAVF